MNGRLRRAARSSGVEDLLQFVPLLLDKRLWFPDPSKTPRTGLFNGLVAIGGDLSIPRLLLAYRSGIFPWTEAPITWWSPDPRGIFELNRFHVSRSLEKLIRKAPFEVTLDRAFLQVMQGCAAPAPGRESTWISENFLSAYGQMHAEGHAHSLECWLDGELVGGIYGIALGGFFAGESMFHRAPNASKTALYYLVEHLRKQGFALFDIQLVSPHTQSLGAVEIPRQEYLRRLREAVDLPCRF